MKYFRGKGNKFNFTLTHIQSETGIVTRKSRNENVVMICAHKPARSSAFPRISKNISDKWIYLRKVSYRYSFSKYLGECDPSYLEGIFCVIREL